MRLFSHCNNSDGQDKVGEPSLFTGCNYQGGGLVTDFVVKSVPFQFIPSDVAQARPIFSVDFRIGFRRFLHDGGALDGANLEDSIQNLQGVEYSRPKIEVNQFCIGTLHRSNREITIGNDYLCEVTRASKGFKDRRVNNGGLQHESVFSVC